MLKRRARGKRPQFIFTSDFHELTRGDLQPGPCVLRYDPHRVTPPEEISSLPATQRPITAHVRSHPSGVVWQGDMRFAPASRLIADYDPTGSGTMLEIEFPITDGDDEFECWFSYTGNDGRTHWDSHMGANFRLRFPAHDLDIAVAEISARRNAAMDGLRLEVDSIPEVERVDVRWRYANAISDTRQQRALTPSSAQQRKRWILENGEAGVASNTTLVFDLVYRVGGHKFTDDNEGTWYVIGRS